MVLFLRLFTAIITGLFKRRIHPLDQAVLRMRAWPNDLDLNFHVNSGRYISFMDIGRVDLLTRMKILRKVLKLGWRPMVGNTMIAYRKSVLPFEKFTVRSRIVCWDEKWFYFEHIVEKAGGQTAAIANVRGLLRGREGNIPPSSLVLLAGHDMASPAMPEQIARWRDSLARV